MSSSEDFNRNIWDVLQKIQANCNQNNNTQLYEIDLMDSQDNLQILQKLADWKVLQIYRRQLKKNFHVLVTLAPIEPKFNNLFKSFELLQLPFSIARADGGSAQFQIGFLIEEIHHFQTILKQSLGAGTLSEKDYLVFSMFINMMNSLIDHNVVSNEISGPTLFEDNKIHTKKNFSIHSNHYQPSLFSQTKPIPVQITDEVIVAGLKESLQALKPKSPEHSRPKFPYKIPAGTCWEEIVIKFLDDERVEHQVRNKKYITDFREMGMIGKGKIPKPCEQWNFLKVLSKCLGELTIKDPDAKDTYKKQKQGLSQTLRHYFSLDYDPFYPYHSSPEKIGNSYKIKIKLIPPPERPMSKDDLQTDDTDLLGIHEYLKTEAPQVVDY